ncbi:hypothetical protein [Hoeflea alexandrii]|uniref:hypothetical protein n=1 Tax=Hoeflea alexandrii TaxID=288436 RepID=UPI0022AFB563|nr:hypothetical protein [Hoeflea alexandrii]MCZ4288217.1 hypothetical protein [Hoeflea alexandrii]
MIEVRQKIEALPEFSEPARHRSASGEGKNYAVTTCGVMTEGLNPVSWAFQTKSYLVQSSRFICILVA